MRKLNLIIIMLLCGVSCSFADTTNPVTDFIKERTLNTNDTMYEWSAALKGITSPLIFINLKEECDDASKDHSPPPWACYVPTAKSGYYREAGVDDGIGLPGFALPQIDPDLIYIGKITQLNQYGIVTVQTDRPKKMDPVSSIYAYTIEGPYLKRTLLATYDPDDENVIFHQYLSPENRTKIQIKVITPK